MHDSGSDTGTWPFVCRDAELVLIESTRATTPRAVIVGGTGVGKSRLLSEVSRRAGERGHHTLRVVGTRSLASVPFGAFAGVIEGSLAERGSRFDTLQLALRDVLGRHDPQHVLLAVDDAGLLDDASAGLVLLAAQAGCGVVATLRSSQQCPDAITRLWTDDAALRVDLEPLTREGLGTMLETALGAPIETRSLHRLWEVTGGNLLFLRELVRSAREAGTLVEHGGVWTWTGSQLHAPGVRDLVMQRVAELEDAVRRVVDTVAVGEPLGTAVVASLTGPDALDAAEEEGIVVIDASGVRNEVRMVHPLYAEVLREQLGRRRVRSVAGRLARAILATGMRRADDPLRVATLQLEAGTIDDPERVLTAARLALQLADLRLAERLARALLRTSRDPRATVLLAEPLYWEGRYDEIVELLDSELLHDAGPAERATGSLHVASALFWGGRPLEQAEEWLTRGMSCGAPFDLELKGQHAAMLMFAGRAQEAREKGREVLDDPMASPLARMRAYEGFLPAAAMCGRLAEVEAELPAALELAASDPDLTYEAGGVAVGSFLTALFRGTLHELEPLFDSLHDEAVRRIDDPFRGVWVFLLGRTALAQGRLTDALRLLREATAVLRLRDPGSVLAWSIASLAQALGMTGDPTGAQRSIQELEAAWRPTLRAFEVDVALGRAWASMAVGQRGVPQEVAASVGRSLLAKGQAAVAGLALHEALRLGADPRSLAGDLRTAASIAEGPVVAMMAAHAEAMTEKDPDRLVAVSVAFEEMGMVLQAAEAAAGAARLADQAELTAQARTSASRARRLTASCGPVRTPLIEALTATRDLTVLTRREHEVALMAGRDMSKREIAQQLHLSVRTVGNHINHVYAKLRIGSREELRHVLDEGQDPGA